MANAKAGEFNLARTIWGLRQAGAGPQFAAAAKRGGGPAGRAETMPAMTCWRGEDERACVVIAPRRRRSHAGRLPG